MAGPSDVSQLSSVAYSSTLKPMDKTEQKADQNIIDADADADQFQQSLDPNKGKIVDILV